MSAAARACPTCRASARSTISPTPRSSSSTPSRGIWSSSAAAISGSNSRRCTGASAPRSRSSRRAPRLIAREDEDVSEAVRDILDDEGIVVRTDATCIGFKPHADGVAVDVDCTAGEPDGGRARMCCWRSGAGPTPTISGSTRPASRSTRAATSSSTTALRPMSPASGRWAIATAAAPSPTPPTTITRSSPPISSTARRAGSATGSPPMRSTSIRRSGASA